MAQTSWPFENVDTSETQFSQWAKAMAGNGYAGVQGVPGDSQLAVTASGSGLVVNVSAGFALVRGFAYQSDAVVPVTLNAVTANRYDRIVLRLDPTANSVIVAVVQGAGASTPVLPALAQTSTGIYEFELANIYLAASTTNASTATFVDARNWLGEQVGKWTTAGRPTAPLIGMTGYNSTLAVHEVWNGTAWTAVGSSDFSPSFLLMGA